MPPSAAEFLCSAMRLPLVDHAGKRVIHLHQAPQAPYAHQPPHAGFAPAPAIARHATNPQRLIDSHGRPITDLRLSITDKCNFRCVYCMEPDVRFMPAAHLLDADELVRVTRLCADLGVTSVRLTGGEPTLHPELERIIKGVANVGIQDLSMTTNGSRITPAAALAWKQAGLKRLTFSLDSVDPAVFAQMTRSNTTIDTVRSAIVAAQAAGLSPIKINAVVMRGRNEHQVPLLAGLARELRVQVRFIEYMPLDSGRAWDAAKLVPASEVLSLINAVYPLEAAGRDRSSGTSLNYNFADASPGTIGLIAPVTQPFCGACSRLRITADGKIRPCLFSLEEWDLRTPLRQGASDEALRGHLLNAVWTKQAEHGITESGFVQPTRPMSAIGG